MAEKMLCSCSPAHAQVDEDSNAAAMPSAALSTRQSFRPALSPIWAAVAMITIR